MIMKDIKNLYSEAAKGYNGGKHKIYVGGTYYGKNWTQEDQANYDLYLKGLEFDMNRELLLDERSYNSPAEQIRRLRDAGVNPDFANVSPDSSPHMQTSAPSAPAGESRIDRFVKVASVAQAFLQSLPEVISAFTQSKGMIQQNQMNSLNLAEKYDSVALQVLGDSLPREVFGKDSAGHEFWKSYDPSVDVDNYFGNTLSRRHKGRITKSIDRLISGNMERVRKSVYGNYFTAEQNRKQLIDLFGSYGFNIDDDTFLETVREFNRIQNEFMKNKNSFDSDYWSTRKGKDAATADNKDIDNRSMKADNNLFTEGFSRANKLLESENRSDQVKGLFLYFALAFTMSKMQGLEF